MQTQQALAFFAFGVVAGMALLMALASWLAGGTLMRRWRADTRRAMVFHRVMGLLLAASVAMLWT